MRTSTLSSIIVSLLLALSLPVAASTNCDAESNGWIPGRYYGTGAHVFSDGDWYEARERNEGHRPGTGEFSWRKLDSTPECTGPDTKETAANMANHTKEKHDRSANPTSAAPAPKGEPTPATTAHNASPKSEPASGDTPEQDCEPAPTWTFSGSYHVGQRVIHNGDVYEAIRPTDGDMPGLAQPARWKQVEEGCHTDRK